MVRCRDMERRTTKERDPAPMRDRRVELSIHQLDADLRRILGDSAEFCLVVSRDLAGVDHVQAMTNTTPERAHLLLQAADACGFDALN